MTETAAPIAPTTLDLNPRQWAVVVSALVVYRDQLDKLAKREDVLGLRLAHGDAIKTTEQLLRSLGWSPPAKKASADDSGDLFEDPA